MNRIIKTLYIVGNRFLTFAKHKHVYTLDAFMKFANNTLRKPPSIDSYEVILGQGLSDVALNELNLFFNLPESIGTFHCFSSTLHKNKASKRMTHKHKIENIMISAPNQTGESVYESELLCDDQCAEMQDHLTGEHLQATLLIEAVRQMLTATAECHWLKAGSRGKVNFVLDEFSSKFTHYIFPLEVTFRLHVQSFRKGLNGNFKSVVKVEVIQLDQVMMLCQATFSAMDKFALTELEKKLAQKCLAHSSKVPSTVSKVA